MKRILPISLFLIAGWVFAERPQPDTVRVRLFSQEQPSVVRVTTADGRTLVLNARELTSPFQDDGPVTIQRGSSAAIRVQHPIKISARDGTLVILTELSIDDYVAGVLAGESSGFRSEESMKAMAVASRTYAAHFMHRHESEGFDFCDSTHCQDLRITAVTSRLRKAVDATSSEVLRYEGQPIPAYYHQNCGGTTEARSPYLAQTKDAFCVSRGRRPWSTELTASDLEVALGLREVFGIEVIERTNSGRAQRLRVSGAANRVMDAEIFRLAVGRALGWDRIRSDLYEVRRSGGRFVFEGYGAGHGIGLCQDGAAVMGEKGYTYKEILAFYFPNTTIAKVR